MTIWVFQACVDGWKAAHQTDDAAPPAMSDEDAARFGIEGLT